MAGLHKTLTRFRSMRDATGRTGDYEEGGSPPEAGFTLIELMVVLLIMGILLAIAIPTFLGVTGSAHAAAAKTNVSSAMTEATADFTSNAEFTNPVTEVKTLSAQTKAMTYTYGDSTNTTQISVTTSGTVIIMATLQKSTNVCWMEATNESSTTYHSETVPPGTHYAAVRVLPGMGDCHASAGNAEAAGGWHNTYPKMS